MKRRALHVLVGLSLVICVASAVLWKRSYGMWDQFVWHWPAHGVGIASSQGRIVLTIRWTNLYDTWPARGWQASEPMSLAISGGSTLLIWPDDPFPIAYPYTFRTGTMEHFSWENRSAPPPRPAQFVYNPGARPVIGDRYTRIRFPHWLIVAVAGVLPLARGATFIARRLRRRHHARRGSCAACGYDLRATPHRCPECGAAVDRSSAPAETA